MHYWEIKFLVRPFLSALLGSWHFPLNSPVSGKSVFDDVLKVVDPLGAALGEEVWQGDGVDGLHVHGTPLGGLLGAFHGYLCYPAIQFVKVPYEDAIFHI